MIPQELKQNNIENHQPTFKALSNIEDRQDEEDEEDEYDQQGSFGLIKNKKHF